MNCKEKGCKGEIDLNQKVSVQTGCVSNTIVHPCNVCGRLHWVSGNSVQNRSGNKAFLKKGRLVIQDETGKETTM